MLRWLCLESMAMAENTPDVVGALLLSVLTTRTSEHPSVLQQPEAVERVRFHPRLLKRSEPVNDVSRLTHLACLGFVFFSDLGS